MGIFFLPRNVFTRTIELFGNITDYRLFAKLSPKILTETSKFSMGLLQHRSNTFPAFFLKGNLLLQEWRYSRAFLMLASSFIHRIFKVTDRGFSLQSSNL